MTMLASASANAPSRLASSLTNRVFLACTLLAASCPADEHEITTIEGVAEHGALAAIQKAYGDWGGAQCGYCTPGFLMTVKALMANNPEPTDDEEGNGRQVHREDNRRAEENEEARQQVQQRGIEQEDRLARVAVVAVLVDCVGGGLSAERILEFQRHHRDTVDRQRHVQRFSVSGAEA